MTYGLFTRIFLSRRDKIATVATNYTIFGLVTDWTIEVRLVRQLECLLDKIMLKCVKYVFPILNLLLVRLANLSVGLQLLFTITIVFNRHDLLCQRSMFVPSPS